MAKSKGRFQITWIQFISNINTATSTRSRAARRAASPSLDLDKSLTSAPRVEEDNVLRDSILADRANAGVTKKQSKPKAKSRSQRLRQQKGLERAEIVMDQLEVKVAGSVKRGKNVKARRVCQDAMVLVCYSNMTRPIGRI